VDRKREGIGRGYTLPKRLLYYLSHKRERREPMELLGLL
jgi:hypothetical protein